MPFVGSYGAAAVVKSAHQPGRKGLEGPAGDRPGHRRKSAHGIQLEEGSSRSLGTTRTLATWAGRRRIGGVRHPAGFRAVAIYCPIL